jgi:hypothetical protein
MVAKKGLVGALAAIGTAMLFVVTSAGAMMGGYPWNDNVTVSGGSGEAGLDAITSASTVLTVDEPVNGYVLDNATGAGIANATVVIIHIPDNVTDVQAYVDKVLSVLKVARDRLAERREKLEILNDTAQQKLEQVAQRLEEANGTLCEKKERLQDAIETAKDRPGGAGRMEMKRMEKACLKLAAEEKKLGRMHERLCSTETKAEEKLQNLTRKLDNATGAFKDRLAANGISIVRADENGQYKASGADGTTVVVALAPGYIQGRKGVDLPASDSGAVTFRLDAKPQLTVYRLAFVWGYLDEIDPDGQFTAWNGSITVSDGSVRLARTVQFEHGGRFARGGNDRAYAQTGKNTVSWRSSTTVARDGVVVLIAVNAGSEGVQVTLTAGEYTRTATLDELAGQSTRTAVDDAGHDVLVSCELLGQPLM